MRQRGAMFACVWLVLWNPGCAVDAESAPAVGASPALHDGDAPKSSERRLMTPALRAAWLRVRQELVVTENGKLTASDGENYDFFGNAVAISGDLAVVGADVEDGAGVARGAAYVFERNLGGADSWGERKKLTASDAADDDHFGGDVAIAGDLAVVGANVEDGAGVARGAVYVFERDLGGADNWGERKKLTASDAADNDYFGGAVAISGDLAIVGARAEDGAGDARGAAYVFERNLGGAENWGERKKLTASDAANADHFGSAVAISGDLAVVGGSDKAGVTSLEGAAYVFERALGGADNWGERKKLTASDAWNGDFFGGAVAISGEFAVVGSFFKNTARGAAYVFERNLGGADSWSERKKLIASDAQQDDRFGAHVAISGDLAVVGAGSEDGAGEGRGAAYVFERDLGGADNWGERKKLTASDAADSDNFGGGGVAISGDLTIVGADRQAGAGILRGAVYVFGHEDGLGVACSGQAHCASGYCVDGVCCDTTCAGGENDCVACSVAAGAEVDGACGPRTDGSACDDGSSCNGADECLAGSCDSHARECTVPTSQEDAGATDAGGPDAGGDGTGDETATDAGGIGAGSDGTGADTPGSATDGDTGAAHAGANGGDGGSTMDNASSHGGCGCRIAGRPPHAPWMNVPGLLALAFAIVGASRVRRRPGHPRALRVARAHLSPLAKKVS